MPSMSKLEKLAEVLCDGLWHTSSELVEKVGHRFGAQILQLRKGELDKNSLMCWVIKGERVENRRGEWRYSLVDFAQTYTPHTPKCPKCGYQLTIHDVREGGES